MEHFEVAVTGATGLVGQHAVKHLLSRGHDVTAVVRGSSKSEDLRRLAGPGRLELRVAELTDPAGLVRAMAGRQVVVHAAGAVDPHGSRQQIMATNVEGTRGVLEAAIGAGARQLVHLSSLSVITGQGDQFAVTEEAPLRYCGEAYADSKVDAEKLVMAEASRGRIEVTALRPGFIYGPGERAWMPRLIASLAAGQAALIDGGRKETNVIYVENLSRAIEASLLNPAAFGQVYNLTDGERVTKKDLFDAIADGLGLPRVTRSVPGWLARGACEVVSRAAPVLPAALQPRLARFSRAAFRLAGVNQGFSIAKAERDLGYVDRIPFTEGMRQTLATFARAAAGESLRGTTAADAGGGLAPAGRRMK